MHVHLVTSAHMLERYAVFFVYHTVGAQADGLIVSREIYPGATLRKGMWKYSTVTRSQLPMHNERRDHLRVDEVCKYIYRSVAKIRSLDFHAQKSRLAAHPVHPQKKV